MPDENDFGRTLLAKRPRSKKFLKATICEKENFKAPILARGILLKISAC